MPARPRDGAREDLRGQLIPRLLQHALEVGDVLRRVLPPRLRLFPLIALREDEGHGNLHAGKAQSYDLAEKALQEDHHFL